MKIIVGLGNPGKEYQNTRHNVGFMVVDRIAKQLVIRNWRLNKKFEAEILEANDLILVKPQTFMNRSGEVVRRLRGLRGGRGWKRLWVVHDDLDLPLGKLRISQGKGPAGHKGVESIIESLGTDDFVRFRVGIGKIRNLKLEIRNWEDYVLGEFKGKEAALFKKMIDRCAQAVLLALKKGVSKAMNKYNSI